MTWSLPRQQSSLVELPLYSPAYHSHVHLLVSLVSADVVLGLGCGLVAVVVVEDKTVWIVFFFEATMRHHHQLIW